MINRKEGGRSGLRHDTNAAFLIIVTFDGCTAAVWFDPATAHHRSDVR